MKHRYITFVLCILLSAFTLFGCEDKKADNSNVNETYSNTRETSPQNTTSLSASSPDENGAIVSKIPNYNSNSAAQGGEVTSNNITLPYAIPDTDLTITAMGGYSGNFVEDNSDENVDGVFAIVVQNNSFAHLKASKIVMTDTEGNTYTFKLSTLISKTSALVMESGKQTYSPDINIDSVEASVAELETLTANEDKISLSFDGTNLKIKNISDTDFSAVYVRYKNFTAGNVYLGGITYSATFENVMAGGEYTYTPAHFSYENSVVLLIETVPLTLQESSTAIG